MQLWEKIKKSPTAKRIFYVTISIICIFILIPVGFWGYGVYRSHHDTNSANQSSNPQHTNIYRATNKYHTPNGRPRKNVEVTSVTKKVALDHANNGVKLGLKVMSANHSLPGHNLSLAGLNKQDTKAVYKYFQNGQAIQQFNDVVNYSSPEGELQWGDAGSKGNVQETTPKPGDPYNYDGGQCQLVSTTDRNFYYKINLQYHAGSQPTRTIPLKLTVNRSAGQITDVVRTGKVQVSDK